MRRGNIARPKEALHSLCDHSKSRRIQDPQQIVSNELAPPYTAAYLSDTGQIVLTPETRVTRTVDPNPRMEERLVMAVRRILFLQVTMTEARYVVGNMTYSVVCE